MMLDKIIMLALEEDTSLGDITSESIFNKESYCQAVIKAKEDMVICGIELAKEIFEYVDNRIKFKTAFKDGDKVKANQILATIDGSALNILKAERTVLNFMQRQSGIATFASKFVSKARKYGVRICDTRKSLPGMRKLDKYAVSKGGAYNHRMSLADAILIKDNHIKAIGGITKAISKCSKKAPHTAKIEVETKNLKQVAQAIKAKADIIMLDNMTPDDIKKAKKIIGKKAITEVSGGITFENIEQYLKVKPDIISIGALTHSAKASDISLQIL